MSAPQTSPGDAREEALRAGLVLFALLHVGLAAFMVSAPHAFYEAIGPFGALNAHYIRDVATFEAALGVGFALAVRRPAWRVPVIVVTAVQFALHAVNHLFDASKAHPQSTGWLDFASLLAATLLLIWMARTAARPPKSPEPSAPLSPVPSPLPERSTT
ncbi:MAG TPA: hypothetical protein VN618_00600 [Solirubrobacteraceae bacterium]|nr:hypothetical protein [Solirubrobacteraceae bacterium]